MALTDALEKLHQSADEDRRWKESIPSLIGEWQNDVEDLIRKIRTEYLSEYSSTGALTFRDAAVSRNEQMLGRYNTVELSIVAGSATVVISPFARMMFGSMGMVVMKRSGKADEIRFLRDKQNGSPVTWAADISGLQGSQKNGQRSVKFEQLSKHNFEALLEQLLS